MILKMNACLPVKIMWYMLIHSAIIHFYEPKYHHTDHKITIINITKHCHLDSIVLLCLKKMNESSTCWHIAHWFIFFMFISILNRCLSWYILKHKRKNQWEYMLFKNITFCFNVEKLWIHTIALHKEAIHDLLSDYTNG